MPEGMIRVLAGSVSELQATCQDADSSQQKCDAMQQTFSTRAT